MTEGEIIEVEPMDPDDTIIMGFEKVWYNDVGTYVKVFFSKSAILLVPTFSLSNILWCTIYFPFEAHKSHKVKKDLQYPLTMSEIFQKIEVPIIFEKKDINRITLKKSVMVAIVTIELQPKTGLFGKPKKNERLLSFFKKDYENVYGLLNTYFKDILVLK